MMNHMLDIVSLELKIRTQGTYLYKLNCLVGKRMCLQDIAARIGLAKEKIPASNQCIAVDSLSKQR